MGLQVYYIGSVRILQPFAAGFTAGEGGEGAPRRAPPPAGGGAGGEAAAGCRRHPDCGARPVPFAGPAKKKGAAAETVSPLRYSGF